MGKHLHDLVREFKKSVVTATLRRNGGNRKLTAEGLGISMRALEDLLAKFGVSKRRYAKKIPIPPLRPAKRRP
jgi:DNA-binding NtrC family response regulator